MPRAKRPTQMALWKVVALSVVFFGVFGTLLTFTPTYSLDAAITSMALGLCGVLAAAGASKTRSWWHQVALLNAFFIIILALGIRAGGVLFPGSIIWPASLVFLYLLAWAIPWLLPTISARIASEQLTPKTVIGRGCQSIALGLVPAAGGLSVLVSRLNKEPVLGRLSMVLIAMLSSAIAIGASQAYAQQYWQRRPWAQAKHTKQTG
jgi:hypothetical protein